MVQSFRWMVGSQCEPTEARRIMPLFDEPSLKATFSASITVDRQFHALWNMPSTGNTSLANNKINFQYESMPNHEYLQHTNHFNVTIDTKL